MRASCAGSDDISRAVVGDRHADNGFQSQCHSGVGTFSCQLFLFNNAEKATLPGREFIEQAAHTAQGLAYPSPSRRGRVKIEKGGVATTIEAGFPWAAGFLAEQSGACQPYIRAERLAIVTEAVIAHDKDDGTVHAVGEAEVLDDAAHSMIDAGNILHEAFALRAQRMLAVVGGDEMDGHQPGLVAVHQVVGHGSGAAVTLHGTCLEGNGVEASAGVLLQLIEDALRCAEGFDIGHLVAAVVQRPEFRHVVVDIGAAGGNRPEKRCRRHTCLMGTLPDGGHGDAVGIPVADACSVLVPEERTVVEHTVTGGQLTGDNGGMGGIGCRGRHTDDTADAQSIAAHHLQERRRHQRVINHLCTHAVNGDEDDMRPHPLPLPRGGENAPTPYPTQREEKEEE